MANNIVIENFFNSETIISPTQNNLIKILQVNGPMTRKDLVNQLRVPRTTIYDNLVKLQKQKVIEKFTRNNGRRGRPLVFWKIK